MTLLENTGEISLSGCIVDYDHIAPEGVVSAECKIPHLPWKRTFDVIVGALAMMIFAPLMLVTWTALTVGGGKPIFVQLRVGKNGRMFRCYKFRSMSNNAARLLGDYLDANPAAREEWNRSFKLTHDPRVTRLGAFLRRSSLDELPQLFNVLKGDMSLVGPRPIVPPEIERYSDKIYAYYACRPGLTGLWQVSGRNLLCYETRVNLDAFYAREQSLMLDLSILLRTIWTVLSTRGAC